MSGHRDKKGLTFIMKFPALFLELLHTGHITWCPGLRSYKLFFHAQLTALNEICPVDSKIFIIVIISIFINRINLLSIFVFISRINC